MPDGRRYQESAFWDDWYGQHRDAPLEWSAKVSDVFLSHVRTAIAGIAPPGGATRLRVCELGCGTSGLVPALVKDGHDVVGCDFSHEVIDQMQGRHPELEWRCCDALQLSQEFDEGSFDFVVAKTLLDCFLTRSDSSASIRLLFEQVRRVLRDHGRFVLVDKACAPHLARGVPVQKIVVGTGPDQRFMFMRVLTPKPSDSSKAAAVAEPPSDSSDRRVVTLQQAGQGLVTHKAVGGSILVVERAEGSAAEAGLRVGDRLLGVGLAGGAEPVYGDSGAMQKVLRGHLPVCLVVEGSTNKRSKSQCDFFLRQQRGRMLRSGSAGAMAGGKRALPPIGLAGGGRISRHVNPMEGLFA